MVTTIFKFGSPDFDNTPAIIGHSLGQQYSMALGFELVAIMLIPVMLCTKPCIFKFSAHDQVHEADQIEFAPLPQSEEGGQANAPG